MQCYVSAMNIQFDAKCRRNMHVSVTLAKHGLACRSLFVFLLRSVIFFFILCAIFILFISFLSPMSFLEVNLMR